MNKIGQPRLGLTDLLMQTKNLVLPADFVQWGTGDASGGMVQPGQPLTAISGKKREKNQKVIYIWNIMVYSMWEQSRRPRVKCHRDGELPGGRRILSTMRSPHPLLHMGYPPLCSNDTRSGKWFDWGSLAVLLLLPFPTGTSEPVKCSLTLPRRGVSLFRTLGRLVILAFFPLPERSVSS